ncbi:ABC transporter ATP-binding protein [Novosphingobium sp.]|uniref:ABC transporter ATP-binding protein n=1 Tax=Novosphingobium sp. TaxID=1874826 RepID=UPI001D9F746A|nr:ABC transporter ATP-binding protein [Novosphingobium sp.]MBX9662616.1 ABC transporter ATP-binding protein [Novosphingobium sp.]
MAELLVDISGLSKAFGSRTVVRDVSMRLGAGDLLGLVGANGGGKTTTLRMLAGLVKPDTGSGTVLGAAIRSGRSGRIDQRQIGYMSQKLALYAELTVLENLRFHARVHGLRSDVIGDALARYGLEAVASQRFGVLSGGWARRVQFATSVLHAPLLLLLDEPTAGLDVVTRLALWDWMAQFASAGSAVVVSTHDLAEAERLPQIMLYRDGRASAQTTPGQLIGAAGSPTLEAAVLGQAQP